MFLTQEGSQGLPDIQGKPPTWKIETRANKPKQNSTKTTQRRQTLYTEDIHSRNTNVMLFQKNLQRKRKKKKLLEIKIMLTEMQNIIAKEKRWKTGKEGKENNTIGPEVSTSE